MFYEISIIKDFAKFTGKHLCRSLWFNKVAGVFLWILRNFKNTFFIKQLRATISWLKFIAAKLTRYNCKYDKKKTCARHQDISNTLQYLITVKPKGIYVTRVNKNFFLLVQGLFVNLGKNLKQFMGKYLLFLSFEDKGCYIGWMVRLLWVGFLSMCF